jgi:hypothetical protein
MREVQQDASGLQIYGTDPACTARSPVTTIFLDRTDAPDDLLVEIIELEYWHPRARGSRGGTLRRHAKRRFRGHHLTCWNYTDCTIGSAQSYLNGNVVRQ